MVCHGHPSLVGFRGDQEETLHFGESPKRQTNPLTTMVVQGGSALNMGAFLGVLPFLVSFKGQL